MGRTPGSVGTDKNRPVIDAGTLARTQSPTPGSVGSSPSLNSLPLGYEEFFAQGADKKFWYCKVAIYGIPQLTLAQDNLYIYGNSKKMLLLLGTDKPKPNLSGTSYHSISSVLLKQMPLEEYEQFLYEQILKQRKIVEDYVASRAKYYQNLDSPYPIPDELKYPEKFKSKASDGHKPFDPVMEMFAAVEVLLQQKETKFVIDLASFLCCWLGAASRIARALAAYDLVSGVLTGEYNEGTSVREIAKDELIDLFSKLLFKRVLNIKTKSIVEVGEWGTSKVIGEVVDHWQQSSMATFDTPMQRYLKVQSFKFQFDEKKKKEMEEFGKILRDNAIKINLENKTPGSPKGK